MAFTSSGRIAINILLAEASLASANVERQRAHWIAENSGAANIVTINGTCTIDLGNGTPAMTNVPFVATITTNADHQGTVGLVLGATALPAATINGDSMSIESLAD